MQILGDPTAQKITAPTPKIQPKTKNAPPPMSIQPQTGTVAVLPPTKIKPVKAPVKTVGKPVTQTATSGGLPPAQGGATDPVTALMQSLYPTPAPLDTAAIQQPYLDAYNKTLAQLGQSQQTENTFDSKLAGELSTLLSGAGIDPAFAKSLQAALQLESLRNSGNTYAGAQSKLTDNYTGPGGLIQQALAQATDAYNKQLPTGPEKLAVLNAVQGQQNTQFNQGLATQKQNLATQKEAWNEAHQLALMTGKTQAQATAIANKKAGVSAKNAMPNVSLSRAKGFIVDSNGNPILGANGRAQVLPGFGTNASGNVVKLKSAGKAPVNPKTPSATWSRANGFKSDQNGNAILANGKKQLLPGFAQKNGRVVKVGTASTKAPKGGKSGDAAQFPNLSKTQVIHLRATAANTYYGVKAANARDGKDHPPVTYQQAINEMVTTGYSSAGATKMANRFYVHPWQRTGRWVHGMPGPKK